MKPTKNSISLILNIFLALILLTLLFFKTFSPNKDAISVENAYSAALQAAHKACQKVSTKEDIKCDTVELQNITYAPGTSQYPSAAWEFQFDAGDVEHYLWGYTAYYNADGKLLHADTSSSKKDL